MSLTIHLVENIDENWKIKEFSVKIKFKVRKIKKERSKLIKPFELIMFELRVRR